MTFKKINEYQEINNQIAQSLDPYKTVGVLLKNAQDKIQIARNAIKDNDIALRGKNISVAILIVEALQSVLNLEQGGEIAENLSKLYQYITETLLIANLQSSDEKLEHAYKLLGNIKEGWDGIHNDAEKIMRERDAK
jgi:flagellar protein FliS